jgi:LysR family transcriptional regulator of gallate degradation
LYRRTASGMETNAVGAELARRLALAFGEIRSGIEEIGAGHMQSRAGLRVGVLALSPRMILAEAMATLLKDRPSQRVDVIEGAYEEQADALRAGAIDVIFGALRTPPPFPDIVEERMIEDPYAIVCRVGHPLARRKNIAASDLAGYDFVLPTEGLPRRAVLDRFLSVSKIKPKSRIETSCLATIVAILRTSDRLSLLSRWHAELDGWSDLFCLERIDVPHPPRFVGLSTRAGWLPTPFQREFLVLTRAAVAKRIAPRERIVATNVVL